MKLYILASGKDAKGAQLEYLTKAILESLGYEYVAMNQIASGGDEIDVFAKKLIPSIGSSREYPLICECKAHESPITMNDWEKFLGKVFKQRKSNTLTQGLMIALSDANGNVKGDYEQNKYEEVQLLQSKDLIQPLSKIYALEDEKMARDVVSHLTNQTVVSTDLILFEKDIYWLFVFASGEFSVFDKKYQSLRPEQEKDLLSLLAQYSPHEASKYKNVRKEFDLVQRRDFVRLVIGWRLMKGSMTFQEAISDVVSMTHGGVKPELKDVEEVLPTISFADVDYENCKVLLKSEEQIDYCDFYRTLLKRPLPVFLYNDYYQQHINENLLRSICTIQFGVELEEEDRQSCLFILRHSPSALQYALQPDIIMRGSVMFDKDRGTKSARNHFMERLLSCLESDIKGDVRVMVFEKLGMRDFSKSITINCIDATNESREVSTHQRIFFMPVKGSNYWTLVEAVDGFNEKYDMQTGTFKPAEKN